MGVVEVAVLDLPQTGDAPVGDAPPGAYRCRGKVYASRETDTDHVLGISCGGMLCLLTTAKDSPASLDAKARSGMKTIVAPPPLI